MNDKPKTMSFTEFLARHREGVADADLTDAFAEVIEAVLRTEKPGSLTLTLKVSAEGDMLAVLDTVTAKIPEKREATLYWRDLAGNLTRNNPLQPSLPTMEDRT
jgi:hypothetical protein